MSKNILIIGATGVIGKPITNAIISAKSNFDKITVLTSQATASNKEAQLSRLKQEGVEVLVGDITKEDDVKRAYQGVDTVISCVGRGAILIQIDLIKWAAESTTVKRFFPSEYGTDIEHNSRSPHEKPHQLKLKVRAVARDVHDVDFTYLVTGPYSDLLIGKSSEPGIGTFDVQNKKAVLVEDGNGKVNMTTMADVGKLLVAAMTHYEASKNKILIVNSFTATPNEVLAEYEKQMGCKWDDVSYVSLDQLRHAEEQAWTDGKPLATAYTLRRIWAEGGTLYDRPRDNAVIGDPQMESLADQVAQLIEQQTKH